MNRKTILIPLTLIVTLILSACAGALPPAPAPAAAEVSVAEVSSVEVAAPTGDPATYSIDTVASELLWTGSNIVGSEQTGTIDISNGSLDFVGTTLTGGSVTIDMTTMSSINLPANKAPELIGHLSNEDFFEVAAYPSSVLVFRSAEATAVENQYLVTADLTIKDVTDELTFLADVSVSDGALTATADIEFDRTQWGVIYGSGSFFDGLGDRVINDEVTMTVTLVANQS